MEELGRLDRLPPYVFATVTALKADLRRQGEDIIDLGMGNPDLATPKHIVDKLREAALKAPNHRYSASKGITKLRMAICDWYKRRYQVDLDPESEAIVTIGAKEGISHLVLAITKPGDVVLAPNPTYPIHPFSAIIAGGDLRSIPLGPDRDFFEDLQIAIRQTWPKPKLLILSFPHNPTTMVVDLDFFKKVVAIAREHQIWVIHDFAYADLVFDGYKAPSLVAGPRGQGNRGGAVFPVQELQHGRLAGGLRGGQSPPDLRPDPDQELPGLRGLPAYSNRLHHCLERTPGMRPGDRFHL